MENYYNLLGVKQNASEQEIKRAFRERAKRLHPDIAGKTAEEEMRKLLAAYRVLSDQNRRFAYDHSYTRYAQRGGFDYRTFLRQRADDPAFAAKLVFYEILNMGEDEAISVWRKNGGINFPMEKYLDREDWMDLSFILADELSKKGEYYDAFVLLTRLLKEERRRSYFKHFTEDIELFLKELVRLHLKSQVDEETWVFCMETLLALGFPPRDEARWLRSMAETLFDLGDTVAAEGLIQEALRRDPALSRAARLRRKGKVS